MQHHSSLKGSQMCYRIHSLLALAAVTFIVTVAPCFAAEGPGSGNGGKGVVINGNPYLLDLVEAGLEQKAHIDLTLKVDPAVHERVAKAFASEPSFPVDLIALKLTEVMNAEFEQGLLMLKTMEIFQWRLVNLPPAPVNDQRNGVQVELPAYVQLAKRLETAIIIDRTMWNLLDPANQTALIFHEIIYAYAKLFKTHDGYMVQDTGAVQEFNAFLFGPSLRERGGIGWAADRVYPRRNFILGPWMFKDDSLRYIIVGDKFQIYLTNGKSRTKLMSFATVQAEMQEKSGEFENVMKKTCAHLPKNQSNFLLVFMSGSVTYLNIDMYESSRGQFSSYLHITNSPRLDKGDNSGLEIPFTSGKLTVENCEENFRKAVRNSAELMAKSYRENH